MKSICILGRQPAIGTVELERLYGSETITPITTGVVGLDRAAADIAFSRLGGSVKLAKYLTAIDTTDWQQLEDYLVKELPKHIHSLPDGKLTLGLSVIGAKITPKRLNATALTIKKVVKSTGRPCRIVPNKTLALSSAQVLHNRLFTSHNWELLLISDGQRTHLAQTTNVQDIEAYAARDQARPKRDARVGMLPPKLAQTLVNLCDPKPGTTLLDPFCGTGVVLQEASLMGLRVYGTDLEPRMIDYSDVNLSWLEQTHHIKVSKQLEVADATDAVWQQPFDYIACETYLGRPFSHEPDQSTLQKVMQDVDTIHKKFLENVAHQTPPGFQMCIAVPAWNIKGRFKHLKTLDSLEELGYTRVSFAHASNEELIYHREGQIVGRELVVLRRN